MINDKKLYRPSFYFTINSLFILLILGVGGILIWQNYLSSKKIVLFAANRAYDQVVQEVSDDFKHTYQPVFQTVHLLSMTPVMSASTLNERLQELGILSTALQNRTELSGLQVGYANGDYFIIRPVSSERIRTLFQAPEKAGYVVDHVNTDPVSGQRLLVRIYYDDKLWEILRNDPEPTEYDPRLRPWYKQANSTSQVSAVEPYMFYFLKEIGTTVAYNPSGLEAVIAADVTLHQISDTLNKYLLTPNSKIALVSPEGYVLGYNDPAQMIISLDNDRFRIAHIAELGSGVLEFVHNNKLLKPGSLKFRYNQEEWLGDVRTLNVSGIKGRDSTLVMISPSSELLADAIKMVKRSLLVTLIILLLSIPVASVVAVMISKALKALAGEAVLISRFDFARPIKIRSKIREVDELAQSMDLMKSTISRFLTLVKSLTAEQNFDAMLEQISRETMSVSQAGGVLTCLVDEETNTLKPGVLFEQAEGLVDVRGLPTLSLDSESELVKAVHEKEMHYFRLSKEQDDEMGGLLSMFVVDELLITALPLQNRQEEVIGLLCLLNQATGREGGKGGPEDERLDFVRTFSGFAAVSLESRQLLEMQKRLMDSFMHLLAGAIDAKSPYTGGHCQRVPVITKMLARAACDDEGLFKDYQLDEEGWEAVHLAGWLHDCGKVTTPEYVVDKSTKLETIYDRIHEVRTRFEVLKRDAEIRCWEQIAEGGDKAELRAALDK